MKAHAGTEGKELADTLAKKATKNGTISESYSRIPQKRGVKTN
jgi:ribonuclease HI